MDTDIDAAVTRRLEQLKGVLAPDKKAENDGEAPPETPKPPPKNNNT